QAFGAGFEEPLRSVEVGHPLSGTHDLFPSLAVGHPLTGAWGCIGSSPHLLVTSLPGYIADGRMPCRVRQESPWWKVSQPAFGTSRLIQRMSLLGSKRFEQEAQEVGLVGRR